VIESILRKSVAFVKSHAAFFDEPDAFCGLFAGPSEALRRSGHAKPRITGVQGARRAQNG
jgi:hypothetical protein